MAVWKERYSKHRHSNRMYGGVESALEIAANPLAGQWVYFVECCGFTFQFIGLPQLNTCLSYYEKAHVGSTRMPIGTADHWEVQRWHERLPGYLRAQSKRLKTIKALKKAQRAIISQGVVAERRIS